MEKIIQNSSIERMLTISICKSQINYWVFIWILMILIGGKKKSLLNWLPKTPLKAVQKPIIHLGGPQDTAIRPLIYDIFTETI